MDERMALLKEKVGKMKERKYLTITCEDDDQSKMDQVEEILQKYASRFEKLGVKIVTCDRRFDKRINKEVTSSGIKEV